MTCNGREPRGWEVQAVPKESGKATEEDALIGGTRGVCKPASPSTLPPRKDSMDPPLRLPGALTQPGPTEGKLCSRITPKFILVLKEQTVFPTCLPSTAEAYSSINNKQSTFPLVSAAFIEQSKVIQRQCLCPGRSPRSWVCRIGMGLIGEEEEGGSPWLQHHTQLQFAAKHKRFFRKDAGGMAAGVDRDLTRSCLPNAHPEWRSRFGPSPGAGPPG